MCVGMEVTLLKRVTQTSNTLSTMKVLPITSQLKEIFNFKIPVCGTVLKLFTPTHNDVELIT